MLNRKDFTTRLLLASMVSTALLSAAVACGTEEEASPSPAREAVGATPSEAFTVEPAASAPTAVPVATSAPTSTPLTQPQWAIREELSQDKLRVLLEDGLSPDPHVIAADDPDIVELEQWEIFRAEDIDGDGRQEAIVLHYTGGAHCCFEYLFFASGSDGIRLQDRFSLGNAGVEDIQDLDGDDVPELIAGDDKLAYFADLSFAASPFLPLVLCRSAEGIYYDCTPEFPEFLHENAGVFEEYLEEAVQGPVGEEEPHSAALGLYFSYLRLGMAEDGESRVKSLCPECWQWLSENEPQIDDRLEAEQPFRE